MPFDNSTRNRLQRLVSDCRDLLTREFDAQLQELFGIYAGEGRVLDLEKLPHLDDEKYRVATLMRERIQHLASGGGGTPAVISEAVKRVLREQAFTVLNRFAALRMAEERGIIVESVGGGLNSKGFKTYSEVASSGLGTAYERYRVFLGCMFDELAVDLGVLFDRQSPFGLLFPRENVLLELFELLNAREVKALWKEDETIGWVYQYFNDPNERKKMREQSAAPRNSRELAVRNQFFTPRYVVEFLTDNTLGRIWYEMTRGETTLKEVCRYLVRRPNEIFLKPDETAPEQSKQDNLSQDELLKQPVHIPHRPLKDPRTILMLDPACGSMHFGLYAFDLFEVIYDEAWELEEKLGVDALARSPGMKSLHDSYADKDAFLKDVPRLVIEHNIHGIDIDPRCAQIAGLSLWLRAQKAWQRLGLKPADRPRITRSNIVCAEPMPGEKELLREFVEKEFPTVERGVFLLLLESVFDKMQLAGEAGSLLKIEEEIKAAVETAREIWQKLQTRPKELFSTGELNSVSKQPELTDLQQALQSAVGNLGKSGSDKLVVGGDFWETAESRIYAALRDYAEQAENGGGFQRRLFAEDAARGFAFIDVCSKRYDVVLMNPPFGEPAKESKSYLTSAYPFTKHDVYAAFVERWLHSAVESGMLGAITSRTGFFLTSYQKWREQIVIGIAAPTILADLGQGVLDAATVETAAYCLRKGYAGHGDYLRLLHSADKNGGLLELTSRLGSGESNAAMFVVWPEAFREIPGAPFSYWAGTQLRRLFTELKPVQSAGRHACVTNQVGEDNRFYRCWWEAPPQLFGRGKRWVSLAKGGAFSPFYCDLHLVVDWDEKRQTYRGFIGTEHRPLERPASADHFFRAGLTWPRRTDGLSFRALPRGSVFSNKGPAIFVKGDSAADLLQLCAVLNSRAFGGLLATQLGRVSLAQSFEVGLVQQTPVPHIDEMSGKTLLRLSAQAVEHRQSSDNFSELAHPFVLPPLLRIPNRTLGENQLAENRRALTNRQSQERISQQIDDLCFAIYGLNQGDVLIEDTNSESVESNVEGEDSESEDSVADNLEVNGCAALLSYFLGSAFGRWDIRYATGEQAAPELPDPFAPLPVCPPGQLQNAQGLPARPEDVPAAYPVRIPWDGILVDDPNHPLDIERCVREVIEIIWSGKDGGPTAEAIEQEACEILGVKSLRDYFRKPANFFADHLKRYSKSRRQAPIYWPISTASGSYTIWIYYHRLTDQTLFQCVNDSVKPKITEVEGDLARLTTAGADKPGARSEIERLTTLRAELVEFGDELLRVAQLPYKPNLNDGVLITAAPIWKLFRLPKWQKVLKACWEKLEKGEYDWAHLAYTLWPDRVKDACKKDRSIAIAHGLEDLCDVKAPEKKSKKGKKKTEQMEMEED